jgi:hypothetical protein
VYPSPMPTRRIAFRPARVENLTSLNVAETDMKFILTDHAQD